MFIGLIIKESLMDTDVLGGVTVVKEETWNVNSAVEGQSAIWHVVTVSVLPEHMEETANKFSRSLKNGKWFVDFTDGETIWIVFYEKIFSYRKGDQVQHEAATTFARSIGIPESQLGWDK